MPDSLSRRELTNVAAGGRGLTLARMGLLARLFGDRKQWAPTSKWLISGDFCKRLLTRLSEA